MPKIQPELLDLTDEVLDLLEFWIIKWEKIEERLPIVCKGIANGYKEQLRFVNKLRDKVLYGEIDHESK